MLYVFSKPYEFEGKTYENLEIDLTVLKGRDVIAAKKAFTSSGDVAVIPAADLNFCMELLQRAVKLPREFFEDLPAVDFMAIGQHVSSFFLGSGSTEKTQQDM